MSRPILLLFNADTTEPDREWVTAVKEFCAVHCVASEEDLSNRIQRVSPHVLCFEFGAYDPAGMMLLARTRQNFPSLPVLMVTGDHSEVLAVWALRTRVWDYFIKPVAIEDFHWTISALYETTTSGARPSRRIVNPRDRNGSVPRSRSLTRPEKVTREALAYVERHLAGKISETAIAERCAMSYSHFSRTFHSVAGVTFREFVLRARIKKAAEFLARRDMSVTTACYEVGFRDPSHFARLFRRYMHCSPSDYFKKGVTKAPGAERAAPASGPQPLHAPQVGSQGKPYQDFS